MATGKPTWLLLLLCAPQVCAQQIDVDNGPNRNVRTVSLFDEIQDARERSAFRELWQSRDPAKQREQTLRFIEAYPRSALLKEAYEIVARASVALGDDSAGLEWSKRSLRLLPENPFLLAMAANLAAKQGQYPWAAASARQALNYLDRAAAPASLSAAAWPGVRDGLRETAYFALGRAAAAAGKYREGEKWLSDALRLNAADYEVLYALGIVRAAAHDDDGAATCFAKVADAAMDATSPPPLAEAARLALRRIYDRQPHAAGTFEEFKAARSGSLPRRFHRRPRKLPPTDTPGPLHARSATPANPPVGGRPAWRRCYAPTARMARLAISPGKRFLRAAPAPYNAEIGASSSCAI
jgi:tetratricopeptide (TPR) repeat protein